MGRTNAEQITNMLETVYQSILSLLCFLSKWENAYVDPLFNSQGSMEVKHSLALLIVQYQRTYQTI